MAIFIIIILQRMRNLRIVYSENQTFSFLLYSPSDGDSLLVSLILRRSVNCVAQFPTIGWVNFPGNKHPQYFLLIQMLDG